MIGQLDEVLVINEKRYLVVGDWTTLAQGNLYVGKRNVGYQLGVCKSVNYSLDHGINSNFDPRPGSDLATGWVIGRCLDGSLIYPYDLGEVSKLECMMD